MKPLASPVLLLLIICSSPKASGQIFVGSSDTGYISSYNFDGTLINPTLFSGGYPWNGTSDGNGNLYWAMEGARTVVEYTTSGSKVKDPLISTGGDPSGVALDGSGYIYVVDPLLQTVGKYTTSGAVVNTSLISGLSAGGFPAIACDGTYLYVGSTGSSRISKYTTSGTLVTTNLINLGRNVGPMALLCANGELFVASNDNRVGEYTT